MIQFENRPLLYFHIAAILPLFLFDYALLRLIVIDIDIAVERIFGYSKIF